MASLGAVARRTFDEVAEIDTSLRCAGVAFFGFLSLFPALASVVAIYALFADPLTISEQMSIAGTILPDNVVQLLEQQIHGLAGRERGLSIGLVVGVLLTLWTGSRGTNALLHAITRAHMEKKDRDIVVATLLSILFTIAGLVIVAFLLAAVAVVPIATSLLPFPAGQETLALWLRWPVIAAIIFASLMILFAKAPHRRDPKRRWVAPGAILSGVLWMAGSVAFSFYIENFSNYNATFGSIAATAVLLLWLYFSAFVLVLGAILNAQLEFQTGFDTTVGPPRERGRRGAFVADHIAGEPSDKG